LANLELLEGPANEAKNDTLPAQWLETVYPEKAQRQAVLDRHDLGTLPTGPEGFMEFYKARTQRMRKRLTELLAKAEPSASMIVD
jgi:hypothetical protein